MANSVKGCKCLLGFQMNTTRHAALHIPLTLMNYPYSSN